MEFSVDDGVRLVRSLTDKVRSALSNFLIKPDRDQYGIKWDEEENLQNLHDNEDSSSHFLQIRDFTRPSGIEPSTSQAYDNDLSNYVDELVKHTAKSSSANLIGSNAANNILKGLAERNKDVKEVFIESAKINAMIEKSINNAHSMPCQNGSTFTNKDLKKLGVDYIKRDELLPLDKIVSSDSVNVLSYLHDSHDSDGYPFCSEMASTKGPLNVKQSNRETYHTKTKPLCRGLTGDTETEGVLKEFEKDILYLSGCKNKTSTPEKHAQGVSKGSFHRKSPDLKLSKNRTTSPKRSPLRRFLKPTSPLVASSPKANISSSSATKLLRRLLGLVENVDGDIPIEPHVHNREINHSLDLEPLLNISPASERWARTAKLVSSKRGARRSLFSEQRSVSRYLPLPSLQTHKPLGYEAYQQFMSVSKSDVLPKYFFENEDEEAVYYLTVKYLDDVK